MYPSCGTLPGVKQTLSCRQLGWTSPGLVCWAPLGPSIVSDVCPEPTFQPDLSPGQGPPGQGWRQRVGCHWIPLGSGPAGPALGDSVPCISSRDAPNAEQRDTQTSVLDRPPMSTWRTVHTDFRVTRGGGGSHRTTGRQTLPAGKRADVNSGHLLVKTAPKAKTKWGERADP